MEMEEKMIKIGDVEVPESQIISMDEWVKENIINNFIEIPADNPIAKKYPLVELSYDDMRFTYKIEDDRINTAVQLLDYDWMNYRYDTKFPTLKIGTLIIRFEYYGSTRSSMYLKQFLPTYVTGEKENYVVKHVYEFSTDIFDKYMAKDMKNRYEDIVNDNEYAYNPEDLMIEWYNEVLQKGERIFDNYFPTEMFTWESVRVINKESL